MYSRQVSLMVFNIQATQENCVQKFHLVIYVK